MKNREAFLQKEKWQERLELGPECLELFVDNIRAPEIESLGIQISGVSTMIGLFCLERLKPNNHTLLYTIEGTGNVTTPSKATIAKKHDLIILPAGVPFRMELGDEKWKLVWFNLNDTSHWRALCNNQPLTQPTRRSESIFHALSLIYHEPSKLLRTECLTQLIHYINESLDTAQAITRDRQRLDLLFQQVKQQLQGAWTIKQLCALVHCSDSHLHRLCQTRFGRSPLQQVIFLKIERAKYLLQYSSLSISQIAEHVGYSEVSNFSKRFKKSVGQSPAQFRKEPKTLSSN